MPVIVFCLELVLLDGIRRLVRDVRGLLLYQRGLAAKPLWDRKNLVKNINNQVEG